MQSVHHAFIKLKAGDFVPAGANLIQAALVPSSRFRLAYSIEALREPVTGWLAHLLDHGVLLFRLQLFRRRYPDRIVDGALGMTNGEHATCCNAGSASSWFELHGPFPPRRIDQLDHAVFNVPMFHQ
jgi:hypothetical protein